LRWRCWRFFITKPCSHPAPSQARPGNPPDDLKSPVHRGHDQHKGHHDGRHREGAGVSQGAISSLLNDRDYGIRRQRKDPGARIPDLP